MQIVATFKNASVSEDYVSWARGENYKASKSNNIVRVSASERVSVSIAVGKAQEMGGEVSMRD